MEETNKLEQLSREYLAFEEAQEKARKSARETLAKIAELASHKVGEIAKWVETKIKRSRGLFSCDYEVIGEEEHRGVVCEVKTSIYEKCDGTLDIRFRYEFLAIKKDGTISKNHIRPVDCTMEWTGETYKSDK